MSAVTAATSKGPSVAVVMTPNTISQTNTAPEIGALYADVIPAAAPHATSRRNCSTDTGVQRPNTRPSNEPHIAASCTIGPSRPMDAPLATEHSDDALRTRLCRALSTPSPTAIASM